MFIFLLALFLRALHFQFFYGHPFFDHPIIDGLAYHQKALHILADGSSPKEVFFQDPLYPRFLVAIYSIFGVNFTPVYAVQMLLGSLIPVALYYMVLKLLSKKTAILASLIAACYPTFIFYDVLLMKESLGLFLCVAAFWSIITAVYSSKSVWLLFPTGILYGLAVMTRGNLLLFSPFLVVWILFSVHPIETMKKRIKASVILAAGVTLAILPVSLRNYFVGGEFVLLTAQGGANFFLGNNPESDGASGRPKFIRKTPVYEKDDFRAEAEKRLGRPLSAKEVDDYWFEQGIRFIKEQPAAFLKLTLRKFLLFFNYFEIPDNYNIYYFHKISPILKMPFIRYGLIVPLALTGMLMNSGKFRKLMLLYLFIIVYAGTVIIFHVYARYRLTAAPFFIIFAASALIAYYEMITKRNWKKLMVFLSFSIIFWFFSHMDVANYTLARSYYTQGFIMSQENRFPEALDLYEKAIEIDPNYSEAYNNIGRILYSHQRYDEAEKYWMKSLESNPDLPEVRNNLGTLFIRKGDIEKAIKEYRTAVGLVRDYFKAQHNLAKALLLSGQRETALQEFIKAFKMDPELFLQVTGTEIDTLDKNQLRRFWSDCLELAVAENMSLEIQRELNRRIEVTTENEQAPNLSP